MRYSIFHQFQCIASKSTHIYIYNTFIDEYQREREGDREFTSLPHNQIHPNIYIYIYESKEEVSCLDFDWHGGVQVVKQRFGLAIFPIAQRMAIP